MTGIRIYWTCWILIGFCVPEFFALFTHRASWTLSEYVWHIEDVLPGKTSWAWSATHFFVFAFLVWLLLHLAFGYFR